MVKGEPARGGKGHATGLCFDKNVNGMTTCTQGLSSEREQERIKEVERSNRYSPQW